MVRRSTYTKKKYNIKCKKGVVLSDLHYPEHSEACVEITLEFVNDFNPDIFILGGDQMEMNSISYFNQGKPKLVEKQRIAKEYIAFQKNILDRYESVLNKECKKYFMIGNHEYRVDRLIESITQFEGLIEIEDHLKLEDYIVIPYNKILKIGKMNIIHGMYHNKHHSAKHLDVFGTNIVYSHVHSPQLFTKVTPVDSDPQQGISIGCLSDINPDYMRGKPNRFVNGFLFFYLMDDGTFYYYLPTILNDKCVINDKVYKYRKHRGIRIERI